MIVPSLGFLSPWLLLALISLPIIYFVLRASPPAPIVRRFPAVTLLLGLKDEESVVDRTPWWLLLLRLFMVAGIIVAFAGPILNPKTLEESDKPLLIILDGGWADAPTWANRQDVAIARALQAQRGGRDVGVLLLSDPEEIQFGHAQQAIDQISAWKPNPWFPTVEDVLLPDDGFDTFWVTTNLKGSEHDVFVSTLSDKGDIVVQKVDPNVVVIDQSAVDGNSVVVSLRRSNDQIEQTVQVQALGVGPSGQQAAQGSEVVVFEAGQQVGTAKFEMPTEIRNRITHFDLASQAHAGAVFLTGSLLRKPEIALFSDGAKGQESLALLSPQHYLRQALAGAADTMELPLNDVLPANPDVIILADVAKVPLEGKMLEWVEKGGKLLRFAGPRLAAHDRTTLEDDPLLPVRLRAGGRTLSGAMTWGAPKELAPFDTESPFYGLPIPADIAVTAQVLAEPGPALEEKVLARLTDGTPLVTAETIGDGQVILVHVTANNEWSNLPISGLFVPMLQRLSVVQANSLDSLPSEDADLRLVQQVNGDGSLTLVGDQMSVKGQLFSAQKPVKGTPAGLYDGPDGQFAFNVMHPSTPLAEMNWPADVRLIEDVTPSETNIGPFILAAVLLLFLLDVIGSLLVSGRLRRTPNTALIAIFALMFAAPSDLLAQDPAEDLALSATDGVTIGYVITGDIKTDRMSRAGLRGLGVTLWQRTSIEPLEPVGLDLASDELAFFPLIYWPVTIDQAPLSDDTVAKLNRYLLGGGMILFDTRDGDRSGFGQTTAEGRKLQELAKGLAIPPLSPIGERHVLTRSFYLIQTFPGRYTSNRIWVETTFANGNETSELPIGQQNDGVTPVIIGGNDWAAAWAVGTSGQNLVRLGSGFEAEQQREFARRFGVNLMMHVLTGNYKSDQVHMPALIERLGEE